MLKLISLPAWKSWLNAFVKHLSYDENHVDKDNWIDNKLTTSFLTNQFISG